MPCILHVRLKIDSKLLWHVAFQNYAWRKASNFCSGLPGILRHILRQTFTRKFLNHQLSNCTHEIDKQHQMSRNSYIDSLFRTSTPRRFAYNNNERSMKFCSQKRIPCSLSKSISSPLSTVEISKTITSQIFHPEGSKTPVKQCFMCQLCCSSCEYALARPQSS